jgi:short-subunit dehydrogenase
VNGKNTAHPGTPYAAATLEHVLEDLGGIDLVIVSAGTGHNNSALRWELDVDTVTVNVLGFMAVAQVAMRHFLRRGRGHVVGISSVGAYITRRYALVAFIFKLLPRAGSGNRRTE